MKQEYENIVKNEVQRAIADRFTFGNTTLIPTSGSLISVPGFAAVDSGPFGNQADRYGNGSGFQAGTEENLFEGVYLDDFLFQVDALCRSIFSDHRRPYVSLIPSCALIHTSALSTADMAPTIPPMKSE